VLDRVKGNDFLVELSGSSKPHCQKDNFWLQVCTGVIIAACHLASVKIYLSNIPRNQVCFPFTETLPEVPVGTKAGTWLSVQCTGKFPGETGLWLSLTQVASLELSRPDFSTKMAGPSPESGGDLQMGQITPARKFPPKTSGNCLSIVSNRTLLRMYYILNCPLQHGVCWHTQWKIKLFFFPVHAITIDSSAVASLSIQPRISRTYVLRPCPVEYNMNDMAASITDWGNQPCLTEKEGQGLIEMTINNFEIKLPTFRSSKIEIKHLKKTTYG